MEVYIECPVCEQQFHATDGPPTKKLVCPSCNREFAMSPDVRIGQPLVKPEAKPAPQMLNSRLAQQASFAKPGAEIVGAPDKLPGLEQPDLPDGSSAPFATSKLPGSTEIRSLYQRRNKRKLIFTLITGGVLAAVIGILSGLLVMQLQKQSLAGKNGEEAEPTAQSESTVEEPNAGASADTDSTTPGTNSPAIPSPDTGPEEKTEKPIRLKDLPSQKLEFLSRKEMDECWEIVQPHLVSLRVTDARGIHGAIGTIVDSRGWILTSYSAVAGASQVEVTASVKSIDDLPDEELLTDLARGVVAIDPENDLAILSVNRRFVVSFADIAISETNRIVEGEYLVQCAPPSKSNPYARSEAKILIRDNLDALNESGQTQAKRRKLTNPDLMWLVATNNTAPLPGTPLARPNGTLAGINVFSENGSGSFLPVDQVKTLIASASDEIKPIAVLGGSTSEGESLVTIADSHPMRAVSERLNQLGDACQQFGWIPQTKPQYQDLQNFAEQVTLALKYVMENAENSSDQVKAIETLIQQWENTLTKRMAAINSEDLLALRKMNKIAKDELKKPMRHVPFYGKVYLGGIDLADKLILKFDVDQTYINIPFEPADNDPMLPDTQWLFFVQTPGSNKVINFSVAGENKIPTFSADLLFAIGPTK